MGKRAGGGAAGAAASTSAGAGVEPATGRGGVPRSATAGLLGALHLVMTLVVAAARAEKEGGCQPAGISQAGLRGCHRALAEAAAGLRPGSRGYGSGPGGRPSAELRPGAKLLGRAPSRAGKLGPSDLNLRRRPRGVTLILRDPFPCLPSDLLSLPFQNFPSSCIFLPLGPLCRRGIFLDLVAVNRQI